MMSAVLLTVCGTPAPKARARTVRLKAGRVISYTPEQTVNWEDSIRAQAISCRPERLLNGPLALEVTLYVLRPKSRPKECRHCHGGPEKVGRSATDGDSCSGASVVGLVQGVSISVSLEKKQELREMSRKEALRVVREVLATYRERQVSGRITVDVRSEKAVWV